MKMAVAGKTQKIGPPVLEIKDANSAIRHLATLQGQLQNMFDNSSYLSDSRSIRCKHACSGRIVMKSRRVLTSEFLDYVKKWHADMTNNPNLYNTFKVKFQEFYPKYGAYFYIVRNEGTGDLNNPKSYAFDYPAQKLASDESIVWKNNIQDKNTFYAKVNVDGNDKFFFVRVGNGVRDRNSHAASAIVAQQVSGQPSGAFDFRLVDRFAHHQVIAYKGSGRGPSRVGSRKILVSTYEDLGFGLPIIIFP